MKQKGNAIIIVLVLIIALGIIGFLVYQNMQLKKQTALPSSTPTSVAVTVASPSPVPVPTSIPGPSLKPGWQLYTNDKYGFEFSHPASYKALTSKDDLYGWEDAILLLYDGGQSYDLAIEIWDSEAQYKEKYVDSSILTVFKMKDGKFITLLNQNSDPEVAEVISTFKLTN
jgi:hypothetical protein